MNFVLQAYHRYQAAFWDLPSASRWMIFGLLLVIVSGSVWTLSGHSVEDSEYLFGGRLLTESEADLVELAFSDAGLRSWVREGRRVRVPSVNRNEYLSALRESASLPLSLQSRVQEALEKASPFESSEQRHARESHAKVQDLGRKISAFPEIRWASVEYDRGERPGLTRSRSQSASVFVSPEGTEPLTKARVNMIKELVRASYAEMSSEDVVVIDTNASEIDPAWADEDPVLRKRREEEKAYEQKVQNALNGYGPIRVTAHAELDVDPASDAVSEGIAPAGSSAGSRASVSAAAMPEPENTRSEPQVVGSRRVSLTRPKSGLVGTTNHKIAARVDATSEMPRLAGIQVKRIRVSVGLPASYYDKVLVQDYLRENPGKLASEMPLPTKEMRQRKRTETESQIKSVVTPLLPADVPSDDSFPLVHVWDYPDLPEPGMAEQAVGNRFVSWISGSWWILALLGLAVVMVTVPLGRSVWPLSRSGLDVAKGPASEFSSSPAKPDGGSHFGLDRGAVNDANGFVVSPRQATLAERSDAAEIVFSQTARQRSDSASDIRRPFSTAEEESDPFQFLSQVDDEILAQRVRDENPQTLAIILASITPDKAARLLASLGPVFRAEVMKRIAKLDSPSREVLGDISSQLRHRLLALPNQGPGFSDPNQWESSEEKTTGSNLVGTKGQAILSSILAQMPDAAKPRSERLTNLQDAPPRFESARQAESVQDSRVRVDGESRRGSFVVSQSPTTDSRADDADSRESRSESPHWAYDRLLAIPIVQLREALAGVDSRQATLALCGLPQSKADAVLNLLSWGQARRARKQLSKIGAIELREIDRAMEMVARQLDSEESSSANLRSAPPAFDSPGQPSGIKLAKAA